VEVTTFKKRTLMNTEGQSSKDSLMLVINKPPPTEATATTTTATTTTPLPPQDESMPMTKKLCLAPIIKSTAAVTNGVIDICCDENPKAKKGSPSIENVKNNNEIPSIRNA
jgi:hypothetical protein